MVDINAATGLRARTIIGFDEEFDNGNSGASININWNNGNVQRVTLTANCTFTFTDPVIPGRYQLRLIQDGTGGRTATFPAGVREENSTPFTLSTGIGQYDIVTFLFRGSSIYDAAIVKNFG